MIALPLDNPFQNGFLLGYSEDSYSLERKPIEYIQSPEDRIHTVSEDETLWNLAYRFYGNSRLWWYIYDTNNIVDPLNLEVGTELLIPDESNFKYQLKNL